MSERALSSQLGVFDRYLSIWVGACIVIGTVLGQLFPSFFAGLSRVSISHVNLPVAVLVWLMIYPSMLYIDLPAIREVGQRPRGIVVTLVVNWLIKPFSMAVLGWIFLKVLFVNLIGMDLANQYMAGLILLAAAPCTGMVFVWSHMVEGDPAYTLVQVVLNDLIMLVAFAPIVILLLGLTEVSVPYDVVLMSVLMYLVVPLVAGLVSRAIIVRQHSIEWMRQVFVPGIKPFTTAALPLTLVIIFAFQGQVLLANPLHILLIAIPILIQVYLNSGIAYAMARQLGVPYSIGAPAALIGSSNFFELAVATSISLFGLSSGATLATVVGVLVEVPVMLSVCSGCRRSRAWFERPALTLGKPVEERTAAPP
jgi:ACR3 family arsenite transporter